MNKIKFSMHDNCRKIGQHTIFWEFVIFPNIEILRMSSKITNEEELYFDYISVSFHWLFYKILITVDL